MYSVRNALTLLLIVKLSSSLEIPKFVNKFFKVMFDGTITHYEINELISSGETALVFKARERDTIANFIILKVAKNKNLKGTNINGILVLENEWAAYELAKKKLKKLQGVSASEWPVQELPILPKTLFFERIQLFNNIDEAQLVMGMECLGEVLRNIIYAADKNKPSPIDVEETIDY